MGRIIPSDLFFPFLFPLSTLEALPLQRFSRGHRLISDLTWGLTSSKSSSNNDVWGGTGEMWRFTPFSTRSLCPKIFPVSLNTFFFFISSSYSTSLLFIYFKRKSLQWICGFPNHQPQRTGKLDFWGLSETMGLHYAAPASFYALSRIFQPQDGNKSLHGPTTASCLLWKL